MEKELSERFDRIEAKQDILLERVVRLEEGRTLKNRLLGAATTALFAIIAWLLGSCASMSGYYTNEQIRTQYETGLGLQVECVYPALPTGSHPLDVMAAPFTGRFASGSAFAVSPRHAVTARHVVDCERELPSGLYQKGEVWELVAKLHNGTLVELVVDKKGRDETDDAALLVAAGVAEPFASWAVTADRVPLIGETVCLMAFVPFEQRTCGPVTNYRREPDEWMGRGYITYGIQSIPGNSGSAVYDTSGRVVAINVAGTLSIGGGYLYTRWESMLDEMQWE